MTVAVLLSLTWACTPRASSPFYGSVGASDETTVRVENGGLSAVAIYTSRRSTRLATVMPGQVECVTLDPSTERQRLIARPVGGGAQTISPILEGSPGDAWEWTLRNTPNLDRLSLVPGERC